jgi:hypothetical protein
MKWIVHDNGKLRVQSDRTVTATGIADPLIPGGMLAGKALHELLYRPGDGHPPPIYLALLVAKEATKKPAADSAGTGATPAGNAVVWFDPQRKLYPPAIGAAGIPLHRLCILRPRREDLTWAVAECLRCPGVGAVVAQLSAKLSRLEVRRLQLATETGGGVGVLLRPTGGGSNADVYAAATRWLVAPSPGARGVQRWKIELIHGHGRHIGQSFILEYRRDTAAEFIID